MKKIASVFLLTLGFCASARQIAPDEAMTIASAFMHNSELLSVSPASKTLSLMRVPGVDTDTPASPYYIFNRGDTDGFVIISGDDRAPKILGYSDKGCFDADNLPPQLKALMEQWSVQMTKLPESAPQHASWTKTPASTRAGEAILMETAEWGQGYPYNALCPVIDGKQAPTGCIATAMAIAMKYHNWPDYTRGDAEEDFECNGVSFDFSSYKIDWSKLSDANNPDFGAEVSNLMLSLGVAAQMHYGPEESAAYDWPYAHKMIEKYFYAKGCQFIEKSSFSDAEWTEILQTQLAQVGPVIYRGSSETVGHAFIVDGYDGSALYHVNWGWDGLLNGYYSLDFADVGFDKFHAMVINITPDKEHHVYSKAFVPNVQAYTAGILGCGDWNLMNPDIVPGEKNRVRIPDLCLNLHQGAFGIAVVDEDDNILQILDGFTFNDGYRYMCPWPGMDDAFSIVFPELKPGQRFQLVSQEIPSEIFPGYVPAHEPTRDPKDWQIVLGGMTRPSHFYMHGNKSEICEVNFHLDEKLPAMFKINSKYADEFTIKELKGHCVPDNVVIPTNGVSFDIKCYDKDGNPQEPVCSVGDFLGSGFLSFNISMYSDKYDVYLNYEYDGDTRRDSEIARDLIIEKDGLVYKILDNGVALIGYDNVGDTVTIPDFVPYGDSSLSVVRIEKDALLFSPIKKLIFKTQHLDEIESCSFAGMSDLKLVTFTDGAHLTTIPWVNPFLKTDVENVYFESKDQLNFVPLLMNLNFGNDETFVVGNHDISFYISDVTGIEFGLGIGEFGLLIDRYGSGDFIKSFNLPGIGDTGFRDYILDTDNLPIVEMWNYSLDKRHGIVLIDNILDNVVIDKVLIDGVEVIRDSFGLYNVPEFDGSLFNVEVQYTVNGEEHMTTTYPSAYNYMVEDSSLRPMILGDANYDAVIDIADAVNVANYIVGLPTTEFQFELADVNKDGDITVSDITSIIALIPSQSYVKQSDYTRTLAKTVTSGYLLSSASGINSAVEFSLVSDENLTALQFDVQFPSESAMPQFKLSDAFASSHMLQLFDLNATTVRVVVYSTSGKLLNNRTNSPILMVCGIESVEDLTIRNIFASDACGASRALDFDDLGVSNTVDGSSIASVEVKAEGRTLVVTNAAGNIVSVYSLDGTCIATEAVETDRFDIDLSSGMYIVTVGNRSHRVIIK